MSKLFHVFVVGILGGIDVVPRQIQMSDLIKTFHKENSSFTPDVVSRKICLSYRLVPGERDHQMCGVFIAYIIPREV